jgi:hypothetical protein
MRNDETSRYKIGVSKDPTKRIEQLQTGNDGDIVLIESFHSKYPTKVETSLQNSFSHTRKRGEWFDLGIEEEVKFISQCDKIEKIIEYLIEEGNQFI